jgi:hypothetical protein
MTRLWLKIPAKVRAQIVRVGRLFVAALTAQAVALGGEHIGRSAIVAAVVAAAEAVFRQFVPVTPAPPSSS